LRAIAAAGPAASMGVAVARKRAPTSRGTSRRSALARDRGSGTGREHGGCGRPQAGSYITRHLA